MLYFDEAGNSGDNLLDKDQPLYLLLSHNFTEIETDDILTPLIKISRAQELHFKTVKKYYKQRQALIECFKNPSIREGRAHYFVAHKEFMIVIQIVDKLIEYVLHIAGIDIYKGARNIGTANILYILGTSEWDKPLFEEMCRRFIAWTRSARTEDGKAFYKIVTELFKTLKQNKDKELVRLILHSEHHMERIADIFQKYVNDATLPCFIEHCHYWSKTYTESLEIATDESDQIDHWRGMIDFLNSLPSQEVGFGSRKHRFPLQIKGLKMVDSKTNRPLQLADLMASYINYAFTCQLKRTKDDFAEEIMNTGLTHLEFNRMWPGNQVSPWALDMIDEPGINPLDFLAEQAMLRQEEVEKINPFKRQERKE